MTESEVDKPHVFYLIAGEPSGDILGARLMSGLKEKHPGAIKFYGIGGPRMAEEGLESLFPMSELSIMGLTEILPHIPKLLGRIQQTTEDVLAKKPAALITIDSPAFSLRVSKKLKGRGIPLIHYVAPSVWAWKPGRAKKVAGFLDHLLALLPFEPPYFEVEGLPTSFIGHSVLESGADKGKGDDFRRKYKIAPDTPVLCMLPGSRTGEITRLLPIFKEAVERLGQDIPGLEIVVPTVERQAARLKQDTENWKKTVHIIESVAEKYDAFAAANVALAASGTVSLELAMSRTPMLVTYRFNPFTHWLGKKLVKVKYASLTNILLDQEVIPELVQDLCTVDNVVHGVNNLFSDQRSRDRQFEGFDQSLAMLGGDGEELPSRRAAEAVLKVVRQYQGRP